MGYFSYISIQNHMDLEKQVIISIVDKDIIYYEGQINDKGLNVFRDMLKKNPNLKKIIINSEGGYTTSGIKIGELIFDNELDVEVETICFSSCANYIFPSGKNKIIRDNSIVGFHGSEHQTHIISKLENKSIDEIITTSIKFSNPNLKLDVEEINNLIEEAKLNYKLEKDFYKKINVSILLPIGGIKELLKDNQNNYAGFTYNLEDMKKFGLEDIKYLRITYPVSSSTINFYSEKIYTKKYSEIDFNLINISNLK